MSGFEQELKAVLPMVHNSFRFGGANEAFTLEGGLVEGNTEFSLDDVDPTYFTGLFTPMIIMIFFVAFWIPSFICTGLCCREKCCCNDIKVAKAWFFLNMSLALFVFFVSIRGINLFKDGSVDGANVILDLAQALIDTTNSLIDVVNDAGSLASIINQVNDECRNQITNNLPDLDDIEDKLDFDEVIEFSVDLDVQLVDTESAVETVVSPLTGTFNFFISITIMYLIVFLTITCIAFEYDRKKREGQQVDSTSWQGITASWHKYLGCLCFTPANILLSWSVLTVAIVAGYIGMLGADQCVPSFAEDILVFVSGDELPNREDICGLDTLNGVSEQQEREYFFCHYLFCEGKNLFLQDIDVTEVRDPVNSSLIRLESQFFIDTISDIEEAIEDAQNDQQCAAALTDFRNGVEDIHISSMRSLEIITCDRMTPIARGILDDAACNGLIAGICIVYVCWLSGSIFLMFAMNAYPAIVFYSNSDIEAKEEDAKDKEHTV